MEYLEKRDSLAIQNEMLEIQKQIGQLQFRLQRLQWELNEHYSREGFNKFVYKNDKPTYVTFDNGSEVMSLPSEDKVRGKGFFIGVDLANESE